MNQITHFFFGLTNRSEQVNGKTLKLYNGNSTKANNAESKEEIFQVAVKIVASSRRPASRSVTVSVEGH